MYDSSTKKIFLLATCRINYYFIEESLKHLLEQISLNLAQRSTTRDQRKPTIHCWKHTFFQPFHFFFPGWKVWRAFLAILRVQEYNNSSTFSITFLYLKEEDSERERPRRTCYLAPGRWKGKSTPAQRCCVYPQQNNRKHGSRHKAPQKSFEDSRERGSHPEEL